MEVALEDDKYLFLNCYDGVAFQQLLRPPSQNHMLHGAPRAIPRPLVLMKGQIGGSRKSPHYQETMELHGTAYKEREPPMKGDHHGHSVNHPGHLISIFPYLHRQGEVIITKRKMSSSLLSSTTRGSSTQMLPFRPVELAPLPIIDLSYLNHQHSMCSCSVMKGALEAALDFFESSADEKVALESNDIRKPVRYGTSSKDGNSESRCFVKQYAHPLQEWIPFWPTSPPHYREKMGRYAMEVRRVALQLINAILESLGVDTANLNDQLEGGMQVMAVNFYPQCLRPDLMLGFPAHYDYGCITILHQSCQGLQVIGVDGEAWEAVPEFPGALHVHIGDHMEVLSNGRYKSVLHRAVLNPEEKRVSVGSIHGFPMEEKVTAAKEMVDEQHPRRYKESSFRDFLDYIDINDITKGKSFIDSLKLTNN